MTQASLLHMKLNQSCAMINQHTPSYQEVNFVLDVNINHCAEIYYCEKKPQYDIQTNHYYQIHNVDIVHESVFLQENNTGQYVCTF